MRAAHPSHRIVNESGRYGLLALSVARVEAWLTIPIHHFGLGTVYQLTARLLPRRESWCRGTIAPGTWLRIPTLDPYWAPVVVGRRPYEPEILSTLRLISPALRGRDWVFVDGGANYGYWSVLAGGPEFQCPKVVAVEPSPSTFRILNENAELNEGRMFTVNRAISDKSGERVQLEGSGHADSHVVTWIDESFPPILTTTIDDVLVDLEWASAEPVVIKLDVEGHEQAALRGAQDTRRKEHLLIYEDHGSVRDCAATQFLLDADYSVFFVSRSGLVHRVPNIQIANRFKRSTVRGYNFVAMKPGGQLATIFQDSVKR